MTPIAKMILGCIATMAIAAAVSGSTALARQAFHPSGRSVGSAAMLATTFLALGVLLAVRPDRTSNRGHEALSSARREG
jgi:hypothetical protein